MTWWVLTNLENQRDRPNLRVRASTNFADHLFMKWAYWAPTRHPIWRTVRGVLKLCGYQYIWDTPSLAEQREFGDTIDHSFLLIDIQPTETIWYYLFAPGGPYGLEIQGPLVMVPPADTLLVGAVVSRINLQAFASGVSTAILWERVLLDTDDMVDLATDQAAIHITIPGWYSITAQVMWFPNAAGDRMAVIISPAFHDVAKDVRPASVVAINQSITLAARAHFTYGDTVELHAYQNSGGNLNVAPEWDLEPYLAVFKLPE